MTAWPLNCTAATAAENVFWRRGARAAHPLMIDSLAVPVRIEPEAEVTLSPTVVDAAQPAESKASIGRRLARLFDRQSR